MREVRKISCTASQSLDSSVPFSLPVIKITIGGNTSKVETPKETVEPPRVSEVVNQQNYEGHVVTRLPVSQSFNNLTTSRQPQNVVKTRSVRKWKKTTENVIRITTETPLFKSAVLGLDTLEPCSLKRIKLNSDWKQRMLTSPDRPDLCFTPATASSGYTSGTGSPTPAGISNNITHNNLITENNQSYNSTNTVTQPKNNHNPISYNSTENSNAQSTSPVLPMRKPICVSVANSPQKNARSPICGAVDFEQTSWTSNTSPHRRVTFKMPLLPNTKRPPTRIKFTSHSKELDSKRVDVSHPPQDDVISIYAGSEILDDAVQPQRNFASPDHPFDAENFTFPDCATDEQDEACQTQDEPYKPENPLIKDWIATTTNKNQLNLQRQFDRMCWYYLTNTTCVHRVCHFSHELPPVFENLEILSENDFQMVLNFTLTSNVIFKSAFDLLLNYMSARGRQDLMLHFVSDIMNMHCDKMPYIEKIINKLKSIGFSFEQALTEILTTTGRSNECLLDILLSFAVDEDSCIVDHWELIQKLISFRKQNLDRGVVTDIFEKCVELDPPNKTLCANIYEDLCVKSQFNIKAVNKTILLKYIALLLHFNLDTCAVYILRNNGIEMQEVQQYLLPRLEETPDPNPEQINTSNTAVNNLPEKHDGTSGENDVEDGIDEHSFVDFPPDDYRGSQYDPNSVEWSEFDLMEEERVQREGFSQTIKRTDSFESRLSSGSYCQAFQPNNVDSLSFTGPISNTTNWICNKQSPDKTPVMVKTPSIAGSSISSVKSVKNLELADGDIISLVEAIKAQDISRIFSLMQKYYEPHTTMKSFVVHMITALKKLPTIEAACTVINKIYKCFGEHYLFINDKSMVDMMRLLGFNLLPRLDEEQCYQLACQIIDLFSKDLNSFTAKCFTKNEFLATKDLRYILIFKIFTRNLRYKDAIRLLKQPDLNILDCFFSGGTEKLNNYKRGLIKEFIDCTLKHSTADAKDGIVFFMLNSRVEPFPDMIMYLNILMGKMLNGYSSFKDDLINMYDNILNSWYKYIKKSILRSFLIVTFYDLPDAKILEFFKLCVDLHIYPTHEGTGNSITLRSNLVAEEIYLIFHYHLDKIVQSKFPINNLVITTEDYLPKDEYADLMSVLTNSEVPHTDMVRRILMVLKRLPNFPGIERLTVQDSYITVPFQELRHFLHPYTKDKLPPLFKIR